MRKLLFLLFPMSLFGATQPFAPVIHPTNFYVLAPTNLFWSNIVAGSNVLVERLAGGVIKINIATNSSSSFSNLYQIGSAVLTNLSNNSGNTVTNAGAGNTGIGVSLSVGTLWITNNWSTNGLASTNYVNTATNGHVGNGITNNLATTNFVNTATNSLISNLNGNGTNTTIQQLTIGSATSNSMIYFPARSTTNALVMLISSEATFNGTIDPQLNFGYGITNSGTGIGQALSGEPSGHFSVEGNYNDGSGTNKQEMYFQWSFFPSQASKTYRPFFSQASKSNGYYITTIAGDQVKILSSDQTTSYLDIDSTTFTFNQKIKVGSLANNTGTGLLVQDLAGKSATFTPSGGATGTPAVQTGGAYGFSIVEAGNIAVSFPYVASSANYPTISPAATGGNPTIGTSAGSLNITTNILCSDTITATNGFNTLGSSSIPTNTANYFTSSNPTNQFTTGILYTNVGQRSLLVGSAVLNGAIGGSAAITLNYTNSAVGYSLPMQTGAGIATTDVFPFCVPLSSNSTFTFVTTLGAGASGSLTNVINWRQ